MAYFRFRRSTEVKVLFTEVKIIFTEEKPRSTEVKSRFTEVKPRSTEVKPRLTEVKPRSARRFRGGRWGRVGLCTYGETFSKNLFGEFF